MHVEGNTGLGNEGQADALWYVAPMRAEIRPVRWVMPADGVVVRSLWSGLSRGTERLVASGRVPQAEHERMRAPLQEGEFPFPVKYGYCAVGLVEQGPPALLGRMVFALHPHQTRFGAPVGFVSPIPEQVPARRAILAANMETALNGLWDSGAGPGDRIAVVGAGIVGLLVAHLARGLPGTEVTVVDVDASRAGLAGALGVAFAESPPGDCDIVFHTSAAPAGLGTAIAAAGLEATVVEMSWYGEGLQPVPLGGAFHSRRLRLVSSQVGQVAPSRRPRWSHARRMEAAIGLLADDRLDALITAEVAFADLPAAVPALLAPGAPGLATAIRY